MVTWSVSGAGDQYQSNRTSCVFIQEGRPLNWLLHLTLVPGVELFLISSRSFTGDQKMPGGLEAYGTFCCLALWPQ